MMAVLMIRILVELGSCIRFSRLDLTASAQAASTAFFRFYRFRPVIHGWFTIALVALYTTGFYMLTPEFSLYFSLPMMILIDASYLVGAAQSHAQSGPQIPDDVETRAVDIWSEGTRMAATVFTLADTEAGATVVGNLRGAPITSRPKNYVPIEEIAGAEGVPTDQRVGTRLVQRAPEIIRRLPELCDPRPVLPITNRHNAYLL